MRLYVGYNRKERRVKLCEDKDTLPTQIHYYTEFDSSENVMEFVRLLEAIGLSVCIDTSVGLYEDGRLVA